MNEPPTSPLPEPGETQPGQPEQPGETPETVDTVEQRLELAMRLLAQQRPGAGGDLRLLPERLPADLPLDLPLPTGARVVGSMVQTQPLVTTILVDAPLSPEQCAQFYIERLDALGWPLELTPYARGGFVPVQPGGFAFLRFRADATDHALILSATQAARVGETTLSVTVRPEQQPVGAPGWAPRRLRPGEPHDLAALIPPLMPPPGASQQGGGGGGGGDRWHSQAHVETNLPVAEVIAQYDQQLVRGGWQRQSGGVTGPGGWSFWAFADAEGAPWRGLLLALNTPDRPRDYFLLLQIEAENRRDQQGGGFSYVPMVSH